jgi:hypothetical protein
MPVDGSEAPVLSGQIRGYVVFFFIALLLCSIGRSWDRWEELTFPSISLLCVSISRCGVEVLPIFFRPAVVARGRREVVL